MAKKIDPSTDDFGAILNCAVRYSIGRMTYMPSLVIGFITPLLPEISDKTLYVLDQDITECKYCVGYGYDEPEWMNFLEKVHEEQDRRGFRKYVDWRTSNETTMEG